MPLKLYITDISPLCDEKLFYQLYDEMLPYGKEKTDSKKLKMNKMQSLGTYTLLGYALEIECIDIHKAVIAVNGCGKPYLKNSDIYFNLSHSGNYAMCVVSDKPVGCDIEIIRANVNIEIAKRFFSREEYEYLLSIKDEKEQSRAFILLWTLKESYIKAIGKGLSAKLDSFSINILTSTNYFKQIIEDKTYCFKSFELHGAFASVCCENSIIPESLAFIDLNDCVKHLI